MNKLTKELSKFNITPDLLREIVNNPDETLYDTATGRYVAIKIKHNIAVIYELENEDIFIITAIYSSKLRETLQKRRLSGRWI